LSAQDYGAVVHVAEMPWKQQEEGICFNIIPSIFLFVLQYPSISLLSSSVYPWKNIWDIPIFFFQYYYSMDM
jgi:hypothetical protein